MRSWILVAALVLGCHRETSSSSVPTGEADALWALAPEGATFGFVATPRAIAMTEHAWQDIRAFLAGAPELAEIRDKLEQALAEQHLGSGNLSDLGLAPSKGFAMLG